jgi:diacylglycerol kinase family enzyme
MKGAESAERAEAAGDVDTASKSNNDETIIQSRVVQVCVVNTPVFGGKMSMRLPDVSLEDRQLDFMVIEAIDAQQLRHTVQQLLAALRAAPDQPNQPDQPDHAADASGNEQEAPRLPGVRRFRARAATIETADAMDVTLDGEIRTHTPVIIRVSPKSLRVLVPPQAKRLLMQGGPATGSSA